MVTQFSRRDFLKASAAAATLAATSSGVLAQGESNAEEPAPVKVGIIGTGSQGILLLGRAMKLPGVEFVGVCDLYEPHLERASMLTDEAESYTDYRKLLERKDLDAVIVATPLYMHAPITIDALDAGKHVFCEKMMAFSMEQAKAMARKAASARKVLQIGHQRRVDPGYLHGYRMLNTDKVCGKVTQVRAQWHRNNSWRRALPDAKDEKLLNWRMYKELSQGLMAELGSHQTDVVSWFLNARPLSVMGVGGVDYWKDGRTTWDNVSVIYEYPGGVKFTYTSILSNEHEGYYEQFMGDQGTLRLTEGNGMLFREAKAEDLVWAPMAEKQTQAGKEGIILDASHTRKLREKAEGEALSTEEPADAYTLELQEFFDCVRTGKQPSCNAQVALETCVISLMANHAINTGRKIKFTDDMFEV